MNTAAVIILFHPNLDVLADNLATLNHLDMPVILVDNSPTALKLKADNIVHYIHLAQNEGIAKAQNEGLLCAKAKGFDTVLLLDQDSILKPRLVSGLIEGFEEASQTFSRLASLSPRVICQFSGEHVKPFIQKPTETHQYFTCVPQVIASGMLINLACLEEVGLKEESLFIDGVDHEWCWRAGQANYRVVIDERVQMVHAQGDSRLNVLGVKFKIGAEIRLYYQFRNIVSLSRRSYVPLYWKIRQWIGLPIRYVVNRFFAENGRLRGGYMFKGLIHGLKGKSGRISDE